MSCRVKSKILTWTYEAPYNVNLALPWSNSLPQKSSCCCSNLLLPQDLCTCYAFCLELSPSDYLPVLFRWFSGKESTCQRKRFRRLEFDPWIGKIPWRRKWQPIPIFVSGGFHGQRSLVGYSSWGRKELDTTEATEHLDLSCGTWDL